MHFVSNGNRKQAEVGRRRYELSIFAIVSPSFWVEIFTSGVFRRSPLQLRTCRRSWSLPLAKACRSLSFRLQVSPTHFGYQNLLVTFRQKSGFRFGFRSRSSRPDQSTPSATS